MIRLFDLRDVPLIHRLRSHCISFHAESALTSDVHLLRKAVAGMLLGRDSLLFVWKEDNGNNAGFTQLQIRESGEQAQIILVGIAGNSRENSTEDNNLASPPVDDGIWFTLIDQMVAEAGSRGIHTVVADVNDSDDEFVMLRHAGFAVYTRHDVWVLEKSNVPANGSLLRQKKSTDEWDINLLYANTVPRLIQLVEPSPPLTYGNGWVLYEKDELAAFVHRSDGTTGSWLRLFVHPGAETQSDDILQATLQLKSPSVEQPLYCSVPRHQSWLQSALQKYGFKHLGSRAVMVKHTVKRIQKAIPDLAKLMPGQQVARTAPYAHKHEDS